MSVADLFATQTAFNQRGLYQDTPESNQAWKTAFDIANNVAGTAEKFRAHDENVATSAQRVAAMNAQNHYLSAYYPHKTQADIAAANSIAQTAPAKNQALLAKYAWEAQNANTQLSAAQAEQLAQKFYAQNAFDGNVLRSPEELHTLAWQAFQNGNLSPQAYNKFIQPYQQYGANIATKLAPFSPELATTFGYMSGNFPYQVQNGQLINPESGEAVATVPQGLDPATLFAPAKSTSANALDVAEFNSQSQFQRDYRNAQLKAIELSKSFNGDIDPAALQQNLSRVNDVFGVKQTAAAPANSIQHKTNATFGSKDEMTAYYKALLKQATTPEEQEQVKALYFEGLQQRGW